MYPIGLGLCGHISGVSWEACFVVNLRKITAYPVVVCIFGLILDMSWKADIMFLNHAKIQCILPLCVSLVSSCKCFGNQVMVLDQGEIRVSYRYVCKHYLASAPESDRMKAFSGIGSRTPKNEVQEIGFNHFPAVASEVDKWVPEGPI